MNTKRPLVIAAITLVLLGLTFSRALAKEVVGATLSGPGLAGKIELSEGHDLEVVSAPWFNLTSAQQPADLQNTGFYEIRMVINEGDQVAGNVTFHYYPGASGQPGYFLFADCQGCASNEPALFRIGDQEDLALRQYLVSLGAPPALTGGADPTSFRLDSIFLPGSLLFIALLALLLLSLITVAFLRSRSHKPAVQS